MATQLEQAQRGQRKAMLEVYEGCKQKVYYVSLLLTGQEDGAKQAAAYATKQVWDSMKLYPICTQEDFTHLAIQKAVESCKRTILKHQPKAFRIPQNRNFLISGELVTSGQPQALLQALPPLSRFLLVLHTVGGYNQQQLATAFKLDVKTVAMALEAQRTNVERLIRHSQRPDTTWEGFLEALQQEETGTTVPESVDQAAQAAIDAIASPLEKQKKKKTIVYSAVAVVLCAALVGGTVAIAHFTSDEDPAATATPSTTDEDASATETATSDETADTYTPAALESGVTYTAQIEVEDYGTITVELDQEAAPITCANFVELANSGFYNGLTFHRIIEGFMMQGGDPNGDGTGGSDNNIVGEFTNNGYENNLSHTRGAISMARSSDYNSASSQFFIVQEDSTNLDGDYAVFGYVTQGMDVVDAICEAAQPTDDNGTISAEDQSVITSITILTDQ